MTADVNSFVDPVVEDACAVLQIQSLITNTLATTDARVSICARSAYHQICSYLNKSLIFDQFKEYYYDQDTRIPLRTLPVRSITKIHLIDNIHTDVLTDSELGRELIVNVDYVLRNEKDLILSQSALGVTGSISIYIEYAGGVYTSNEHSYIHECLLLQTVVNYNRLASLGTSVMSGAGGSIALSSDSGGLIETVQYTLDPHVYHGAAELA